jgi:hypothetical protein
MKKSLTVLLLFVSGWCVGQTNVYHPFPDSNAVWNVYTGQSCGWGFDMFEVKYSYVLTEDTVINDTVYHKLDIPAIVGTLIPGQCDSTIVGAAPGHYAGAIRQDTAAHKVFIVPPFQNNEQLLYDFNMQVGDSVYGYIQCYTGPPDTVISIDSVLIGNSYRKRWIINDYYNINYIEGIGSTYGLLSSSPGYITDQMGAEICFMLDDVILYSQGNNECTLITSVNEFEQTELQIYPNPATTSLTLTTEQTLKNVPIAIGIKIMNAIGQEVYHSSPDSYRDDVRNSTPDSYRVDISQLPPGLYYLTLQSNEGVATKKFEVVR